MKVLATLSTTVFLVNACLPLLVLCDPSESNESFRQRIHNLQGIIYENTSKSLYHALGSVERISISSTSLCGNAFYCAGNPVTVTEPFMACFQRSISENEISWAELLQRVNDTSEGKDFNTITFICNISNPTGMDLPDIATVTPSRDNLLSILQYRLQISLTMIRSRRLMAASKLQLEDCFSFTSTVDNMEICTACGQKASYLMQQCFPKLPPILVIVLKRFSYTPSTGGIRFCRSSSKITTMIEFPLEGLDMHSVVCGESHCVYDLCCVCNHSGTAEFGHYYAYCCEGDNRWFEYNDEIVHEIPKEAVRSANAYLLFYRKRDTSCEDNSRKEVTGNATSVQAHGEVVSPESMDRLGSSSVSSQTTELHTTSTMKNLELDRRIQQKPRRRYLLFFLCSFILLLLLLVVLYF